MSFDAPNIPTGGGGLLVGSIYAKVGALFDPKGWREQQTAADQAEARAKKPIVQDLSFGDKWKRNLDEWKRESEGARAEAKKPIETTIEAKTAEAIRKINEYQVRLGKVPDKISTRVDLDTAVANAKLDLLNARLRDYQRDVARAQLGGSFLGGGGAGHGGGIFAGMGNPFGGLPFPLLAAPALTPLAAGGLGAATSVLGSAGAGALGVGALGTGAAGIGAAGLGPLLILKGGLTDAIKLSGQLETAETKLTAAQAIYGAGSKQAAAAQISLDKVMAGANPAVLKFAKTWGDLTDTLDKASRSVLPAFGKALAPITDAITQLMPTIEQMARIDLSGVGKLLDPLERFFRSTGFKTDLIDLAKAFEKIAPALGGIATNLLTAFLNVAVASAPYVIQIADALEKWTKHLADATEPGQRMNGILAGLVGQARSWFNLTRDLGKLLVTVLKGGAADGQHLVDQLDHVLVRWNAWLGTTAGQAAMHKFFADSANLLRGVLDTLKPIVALISSMSIGLIPTFTTLLAPIAKMLAAISEWINGLSHDLPPVLNALPGLAVAVGVLASWKALKALTGGIATDLAGAAGGKLGIGRTAAAASAGITAVEGTGAAGGALRIKKLRAIAGTGAALTAEEEAAYASMMGGGAGAGGARSTGGLGIGTKILGGLGIASIGTVISTEIGGAIKGGVGLAVKDIGTGASIGGGLGSIFGPWGAAAGAALGAGVGAAISLFTSHAKPDGEKWADQFTSSLPNKISEATRKGLEDGQKKAPPLLPPGQPTAPGAPGAPARGTPHSETAPLLARNKEAAAELVAFTAWAGRQGKAAGDAWAGSMNAVKFPTQLLVVRDAEQAIAEVPKKVREGGQAAVQAWQNQAAAQMIAYAQGLEKNGKLPKGSVDRLITSLENQFPALLTYLANQGLNSDKAVAKSLEFTQARASLKTALENIRTQWGDTYIQINLTNENINKNTKQAEDDLNQIIHTSHGKRQVEAKTALANLEKLTRDSYSRMTDQTIASMAAQQGAIAKGTAGSAHIAEANFGKLVAAVNSAMQTGVLATSDGSKLIGEALNSMLAALGASKIPLAGLTGKQLTSVASLPGVQQYFGGAGTSGLHQGGLSGGGALQIGRPGTAGLDTVPMSIGGQNFAVGEGEQVVVFNRHQIPEVNQRFADTGGLAGYFNRRTRPNYMAGGGIAAMIARANFDDSLHQPYLWGGGHGGFGNGPWDCSGAVSDVLHAGGALSAPRVSGDFMNYGQPGPGKVTLYANPTHVYMSLLGRFFGTSGSNPGGGAGWFPGAPRPGFAVRHIDGGGAGFGDIKAPGVSGSGIESKLARLGLSKEAAAANAYLAAHIPGGAFGGGNVSEAGTPVNVPGNVASWLQAGMKLAGVSGPLWLPMLERQTMRESGGHPDSINRTDSNARAGNPSEGLLQTTLSTFRQYAVAGHTNILNPVDNTAAAIDYMVARYGHGNAGAAVQTMWNRGGGPYARGGIARHAAGGAHPAASAARATRTGLHAPTTSRAHPPKHGFSETAIRNLLGLGGKKNHRLAGDLRQFNQYDTEIQDLGTQFDRLQRQQGIADKIYGAGNVPANVYQQQSGALIAIKNKIVKDLGLELKAGKRLGAFVDDWLPDRTQKQRLDEARLSDDEHELASLQTNLTGLQNKQRAAKTRSSEASKLSSLKARLGKLQAQQGRPKSARRGAVYRTVPAPVRYDPYGHRLPPGPPTKVLVSGGTQTPVATYDNTDAINTLQSQIRAAGTTADTALSDQKAVEDLKAQIKKVRDRIKADKATDKTDASEIKALQAIKDKLGGALDPTSGIAGTIADTNLDIQDLAPPAADYTVLPAGEQEQLDKINYALSVAEGLPASQQTAAEIPLAQQLVAFWTGRAGELSAAGAPLPARTSVQDALNAAKDQLAGLTAPAAQTADQAAQLAQSQGVAANLQQMLVSSQAAVSALTSTGDIGVGGFASAYQAASSSLPFGQYGGRGGGTPGPGALGITTGAPAGAIAANTTGGPTIIQNFSSLHPADPTVKAQIAAATVDALGGQTYRGATRVGVL